ncbi:unnamed protein product [marine sediment metagenome]|uniref:Uncharacterized protein n=1 Tax=marine sediment metagenome TaxID=412755 RepID=X1GAX9_9ZZZZ
MEKFKLSKINNGINITQEEWDKFQKDLRILKFQMQENQDSLEGGLTSRNISSFLNTYIINEKDSLDDTYDMYVHFNIISEMIKIVSVKVSFWILNYRAYSTAAKSGGEVTSASGGGETPTSSSGGSSTPTTSSGGATTPTTSASSGSSVNAVNSDGGVNSVTNVGNEGISGYLPAQWYTHAVSLHSHTHTVYIPNHTHTVTIGNHTHTVTIAAHTHVGGAHTHDITYGIHEEETSPTIKFYISDTGEDHYSDTFFGGYTADKANIDITDYITSVGSKMIKFTSTTRTRLSVQIEIKLEVNY